MLAGIQLDHEPSGAASEIGNVRADRQLPDEAQAQPIIAQLRPQPSFGVGGLAAHLSGAMTRGGDYMHEI